MEIMSPETISQELCALVHKKCSARSTHIQQVRHPGTQFLEMLSRQKCHYIYVQIHTQGANLCPQGSSLNFAQSWLCIYSFLRITHHAVWGGKICQISAFLWPAAQAHSSVALSASPQPAHSLLQLQHRQIMQKGPPGQSTAWPPLEWRHNRLSLCPGLLYMCSTQVKGTPMVTTSITDTGTSPSPH